MSEQQFGDVKVLAQENLAVPNRPKTARRRREPKLYVIDGFGNNKPGFVDTEPAQNEAALSLDEAIRMGLIKPEHVNKEEKLTIDPNDLKIDPAPFAQDTPVNQTESINQVAEDKIRKEINDSPVIAPVVQETVVWEDPTDNMSAEDLLNALGAAIAYERDCGEKINLVDQNGQVITGLQVVREKPQFIGM